MKVGDLVNFKDNKGNVGTGIVKRIRSATHLNLDVKRKNGRFQLFLNVPKGSTDTDDNHLASWSPIQKEVTDKQKKSFKNKDKEKENETFSPQKDL